MIERPWGTYNIEVSKQDFQIKTLTIEPGKRLSDQRHKYRGEAWTPLNGVLTVHLNGELINVYRGQTFSIEPNVWHRLENVEVLNNSKSLSLIEIQTGTSFDEEDIERRADDFGRV